MQPFWLNVDTKKDPVTAEVARKTIKLKLIVWTGLDEVVHYIPFLEPSRVSDYHRTREIKPDGSIDVGPRVPTDELPGGSNCKSLEIEAEIILP